MDQFIVRTAPDLKNILLLSEDYTAVTVHSYSMSCYWSVPLRCVYCDANASLLLLLFGWAGNIYKYFQMDFTLKIFKTAYEDTDVFVQRKMKIAYRLTCFCSHWQQLWRMRERRGKQLVTRSNGQFSLDINVRNTSSHLFKCSLTGQNGERGCEKKTAARNSAWHLIICTVSLARADRLFSDRALVISEQQIARALACSLVTPISRYCNEIIQKNNCLNLRSFFCAVAISIFLFFVGNSPQRFWFSTQSSMVLSPISMTRGVSIILLFVASSISAKSVSYLFHFLYFYRIENQSK